MADDLYTAVLGIPAGRRPPHHYDLLGVALFEPDIKAIHSAAVRRRQQLSDWAQHSGQEPGEAFYALLDELNHAAEVL